MLLKRVNGLLSRFAACHEYDPFGNTAAMSGPLAGAFRFRFSTKCQDAATGLYYYGYRFYAPSFCLTVFAKKCEKKRCCLFWTKNTKVPYRGSYKCTRGGLSLGAWGPGMKIDGIPMSTRLQCWKDAQEAAKNDQIKWYKTHQ
jgi:hypothetical protein